jgi:hypothetical protein
VEPPPAEESPSIVTLVLEDEPFDVPHSDLSESCELFREAPSAPYHIQSPVPRDTLLLFLSRVRGESITLSDANSLDLDLLTREFRFAPLADEIATFLADHSAPDLFARREVRELRAAVTALQAENAGLREQIKHLVFKQILQADRAPLDMLRRFFPELSSTDLVAFGKRFGRNIPPRDDPLDGIIAFLTRKFGGNVHDKHIVSITASSQWSAGARDSGHYAAKNAADLKLDKGFRSGVQIVPVPGEPNNWLCYDFKERKIIPTHYTIRSSYNENPGGQNPKAWRVEVSEDGKAWTEVDRQDNYLEFNNRNIVRRFEMAETGLARFVRLVHVGGNWANDSCLEISGWEIFGHLIE